MNTPLVPAPSLSVGIDVAKASFVVGLWQAARGHVLATLPNNPNGFAQLATLLQQAQAEVATSQVRLVLEPTAGYELPLAYFAHAQGWQVCVVNPRLLRDWMKGLGQRAKTDRLDAQLLARYGHERQPTAWQPLPTVLSQLDSLLTRRRELEQLLQQERNRQQLLSARPALHPRVLQSFTDVLSQLEQAHQVIEQAIADVFKTHPPLQQQADALDALPGIGDKSVLPLLCLLSRWQTMTDGQGSGKALTAYVGLDPRTEQSGQRQYRRGISKQGDPEIRRVLFMAVLGGIRGQNGLREFYDRLVARGKPKKVALIAAARKLLTWAWAVFRSGQPFDAARVSAAPITQPA